MSGSLSGLGSQINAAYRRDVEHPADAATLQYWEQMISTGQRSLSDVEGYLQTTPEAKADAQAVQQLYQSELGRGASNGEVADRETDLSNGQTMAGLQGSLAGTGEAVADIQALYQTVLGRAATGREVADRQADLAGGQSLAGLRGSLSQTGEAAGDIAYTISTEAGRTASAGDVAYWQGRLAKDTSLSGLRTDYAYSDEAANAVQDLYQSVLGRAASATELGQRQAGLNGGASLGDLRRSLVGTDAAVAGIQALYVQVLGRAAGDGEVLDQQGDLVGGQSLAGLRASVAGSAEVAGDIGAVFQAVLGRAADSNEVAAWQQTLGGGGATLALMGSSLATSAVNGFYQQLFGRDATAAEVSAFKGALAAGQSLSSQFAGLRPQFATSASETGTINGFYQRVFGRDATAGELSNIEGALAAGQSLEQIRSVLLSSDTVTTAINGFYHDVLGVDADPSAAANIKAALAAGQSLAQAEAALRPQFAHSATAAASIQALYRGVAGRDAGAGELATSEDALAAGQSLGQMRAVLLNSSTASVPARQVDALYQQVLGRDADLGGLALGETALAGGTSPDQLRSGLAHSAEAARDLNVFYQEALGRDADAAGLAGNEDALASGLPLGGVRDALAHSQEATNQVQATYAQRMGRAASTDEVAGYEGAKAMALPPGATFTVRDANGMTLAVGVDAKTLVANLQTYVTGSGNLTPSLVTQDGQVVGFKDAKQLAAFALAQAVTSGQASADTSAADQRAAAWLDQTGQGYIQAATNLLAMDKADTAAGDTQQALLDGVGAQLAMQIQAMALGQRHSLTQRVSLPDQFAADVTVSGDVEGGVGGPAKFGATLVDLDPERPGLVQDALAQASAANHDAGNPLLAALDQVQERLDLAQLRLPADARHDKMFDVARQFIEHARGAAASGNWNLVQTFETAADVSLQEAVQPAGARQALTERFVHKEVKHDVTVDPNSADPFATFKDHSKGHDDVGAIVESIGGAVLNVVAVFQPYLWPAAVAVDTAQAGQSFSQGNVLGGVLSIASALGVGLNGLGQGYSVLGLSAGNLSLTSAQAATIGGYTLAATAAAGGAAAAVQAVRKGDGLGIAAGLLQVLAAAAAGEGVSQGGGSVDLKLGTIGLGVLAGAATLANGADTGGLAGALTNVGALATAIAGAVQQVNTDPSLQARLDQLVDAIVADPAKAVANIDDAGPQGTQFAGPGVPTSDAEQQAADFKALLTLREGRRNDVYLDNRGIPTVGIGHAVLPEDNLKVGDIISDAQVEAFYARDSQKALNAARSQAAQAGITDTKFIPYLASVNLQLGTGWRNDFKQTWADIMAGNYPQAAHDAADSRWYQQTPNRVKEFQGALLRLSPKP